MNPTPWTQKEKTLLLSRRLPNGWRRVKSSSYAWVAVCRDGSGQVRFFKFFLARSPAEAIKAVFKGRRSVRFVKETERLKGLGFLAPDVLAHGAGLWSRLKGEGWCLTRGLKGCGVMGFLHSQIRPEERRGFISALAAEVARFHNQRIRHGDLRLSNIFVMDPDDMDQGRKWRFAFLDNERNRLYLTGLPWRERCRNLVQMNIDSVFVDVRDRLYFLGEYAKASGFEARIRRVLIRDVADWTERRIKARFKKEG
ncbi:MAG: hypothetical protein M0022_06745 [Desulfobacteraceae bacterium]|nr:hypothetical protein [Desulfobacteraceae bacterium]